MGWAIWGLRQVTPWFVFLGLLFSPALFADDEYHVGYLYKVPLDEVLPTQYAVSFKEVAVRVKTLGQKDDDGDIKKYKLKKAGQAVVGPGGKLYLVDGHHFASALIEYGHNKMWVEIEDDLSDLSPAAFWKEMKARSWVYLIDHKGKEISVSDLPKRLTALKDDPYRGVAWMVRKCGGFKELDVPFQEFRWAEFFREHLTIAVNASDATWEKVVRQALALAASDEASHLPGWHGKKIRCADIFAALGEDNP